MCTDRLRRRVDALHQCVICNSVASYLMYADVRLHIPMTRCNGRYAWDSKKYMNVYICDAGGTLGWTQYPWSDTEGDKRQGVRDCFCFYTLSAFSSLEVALLFWFNVSADNCAVGTLY